MLSAQGGGGGTSKEFVLIQSGEEWTPPVELSAANLVLNAPGDKFYVLLKKGDYKPGLEINVVSYMAGVVVVAPGESGVAINTPNGQTLGRDSYAKLIYVGKNVWLLRGYSLNNSGPPRLLSVTPGFPPKEYSPLNALVQIDNVNVPANFDVWYYYRKTGDEGVPQRMTKSGAERWYADIYGLEGWTKYDFWATYHYPESGQSVISNIITYEVQGDKPKPPLFEPKLGRGVLALNYLRQSAPLPKITKVQASFRQEIVDGKVVPVWVDCGLEPYYPEKDIWSFLATNPIQRENKPVLFRFAGDNGVWTEPEAIRNYPFRENLEARKLYSKQVDPTDPFKGFEIAWVNKDIAQDDRCRWIIITKYFVVDGGYLVSEGTEFQPWQTTSGYYTKHVIYPTRLNLGPVRINVEVYMRCYDVDGESSTIDVTYDSGPVQQFEFKSITPDYKAKLISTVFSDSVQNPPYDVKLRLSKNGKFDDSVLLRDVVLPRTTTELRFEASKLPQGYYFVQAQRTNVGGWNPTEWLPKEPFLIKWGNPPEPPPPDPKAAFRFENAEAYLSGKSVRVRVDGVDLRTDRVVVQVSYKPDFSVYQGLTGGEYVDGWFVFNGTSLVDKDLYVRAARWREGKGIDTPYLPDPPMLVKWIE